MSSERNQPATAHPYSGRKSEVLLNKHSRVPGLLIILLLLMLPAEPAQAVIGRHDVAAALYVQPAGAYPAVFDIFPGNGTATLIAPAWAIPAALAPRPARKMVPIRCRLVRERTGSRESSRVLEWGGAHFHDMALMQLNPTVSDVVPLPIYRGLDEAGQIVTLLGRGDFGDGENGLLGADRQLRAATNQVEREESGGLWLRFDEPGSENTIELEGVAGPSYHPPGSGGTALPPYEMSRSATPRTAYEKARNRIRIYQTARHLRLVS